MSEENSSLRLPSQKGTLRYSIREGTIDYAMECAFVTIERAGAVLLVKCSSGKCSSQFTKGKRGVLKLESCTNLCPHINTIKDSITEDVRNLQGEGPVEEEDMEHMKV